MLTFCLRRSGGPYIPSTPWLSAIVEVERLITSRALDLIVDRTRNVANATGVAIGLLSGVQVQFQIRIKVDFVLP